MPVQCVLVMMLIPVPALFLGLLMEAPLFPSNFIYSVVCQPTLSPAVSLETVTRIWSAAAAAVEDAGGLALTAL